MKLQLYRRIKILGGLIPNCSSCKRIRDDKGFWNQLEHYIYEQSEAKFTQGVCRNVQKNCMESIIHKSKNQTNRIPLPLLQIYRRNRIPTPATAIQAPITARQESFSRKNIHTIGSMIIGTSAIIVATIATSVSEIAMRLNVTPR